MSKKFCNHCGRLYETKCTCRKEKRNYKHINFYDSTAWRSLSNFIRTRDYDLCRLAFYMQKHPYNPETCSGVYKLLYDYLIDAYGQIRSHGGGINNKLIVHHIVPREDDYSLQYVAENLITLDYHTHEFIHQLYNTKHKKEVQQILKDVIAEEMF